MHAKYPTIRLAALVENMKSVDRNLDELEFTPSIYSPYYKLLSKQKVDFLHRKNIRVIPWTVNEVDDMKKMKSWGTDGFITDYPNRASDLGYTLKKEKK
jgi:glycerophosphoryl diester phosphodiesterase